MKEYSYIIVGAGLWGCVMAERITSILKKPVLLVESRDHIGGNCYSQFEPKTGIEYHVYGTHIFHTSDINVWNYISNFTKFNHYKHSVYTLYNNSVYNFPVNLKTINDFYKINLKPSEVQNFIDQERQKEQYPNPANLEQQAINLIGRPLYEAFVKGYTEKQWEKPAKELPSFIIQRLPIRDNYENNYFFDPYQGIPLDGYTKMFEKLLSNPLITVMLKTPFSAIKEQINPEAEIFYTGPIDSFFNYQLGDLEYRSLRFELEIIDTKDYQGTSVLNYANTDVPFTRIHEFKHLHPERKEILESHQTLICREYPMTGKRDRELYYPVNTTQNQALLEKYQELAKKYPNIHFKGRLGGYRYLDMDKVIADALEEFDKKFGKK